MVEVYAAFDISADDQGFIMVRDAEIQRESRCRIMVTENWLEEVKEPLGN